MTFLNKFRNDESGAVTVDWVVITAAVVGLSVLIVVTISGASGSVGSNVGDFLTNRPVGQ